NGQRLEDRPQLEHRIDRAVGLGKLRPARRLVGIYRGPGCNRPNSAGRCVKHDARPALHVELGESLVELVLKYKLHARIDGKAHRLAASLQLGVERQLRALDALAVDIGEAKEMSGKLPARIDTPRLLLEAQSFQAEIEDRFLLARGQPPLDPHEL